MSVGPEKRTGQDPGTSSVHGSGHATSEVGGGHPTDSAWSRLAHHLESNAEGYGPIVGTLSAPRIGMIWLAANLVVTTLLTGTLFVPGVPWFVAVGLIVAGSVLGALVLVLVGNMGTRTGLPTMALTKGAFGLRGSFLPVAANVVILMGWSWVQAMLAGVTLNHLVAQATGFSSPILFSVLCQSLVVVLAILGHEGIAKVEPWFAVVILAIMAWIFTRVFTAFPVRELSEIPVDQSLGMDGIGVLDVVIATAVSWTVLSAEFNRLARSQAAGVFGSGLGYLLSTCTAMILGATAMAYVVLDGGAAVGFDPTVLVGAFGAPVAIAIFLSVMATNTMVVYGMVSSVVNVAPTKRLRFLPTALVLGAISILGATWLPLLDRFTGFLSLIGSLFIPVFAIMLVDYYIVKRSRYDADILRAWGGTYWYVRGVNWAAVVVWVIGAGISLGLTYTLISPVGVSIPTFAVSALMYLAWALFTDARSAPGAQRHLAAESPAANAPGGL